MPSMCESQDSRDGSSASMHVSDDIIERVCKDISRCVLADTCYSPLSDLAKQAAGELSLIFCFNKYI